MTSNLLDIALDPPHRPADDRDWPAYDIASARYNEFFGAMLLKFREALPELPYNGTGRPPYPLRTQIAMCLGMVWSKLPSRKFPSWMRGAQGKGWIDPMAKFDPYYIGKKPDPIYHRNTVTNAMKSPLLTPHLRDLVVATAMPFQPYVKKIAVDATGFTLGHTSHWNKAKHGSDRATCRQGHKWLKCNIVSEVHSNTVLAVDVSYGNEVHDSKHLPELLGQTVEHFSFEQVSGDKAYLSHSIYELIESFGALPLIPFKSNTKPVPWSEHIWDKMYHMFSLHRDLWDSHYHLRSNVETTFAMIKANFGENIRSRTPIGHLNEVLCKLVCHNIWVLNLQLAIADVDLAEVGLDLSNSRHRRVMNGGSVGNGLVQTNGHTNGTIRDVTDVPYLVSHANGPSAHICRCRTCIRN